MKKFIKEIISNFVEGFKKGFGQVFETVFSHPFEVGGVLCAIIAVYLTFFSGIPFEQIEDVYLQLITLSLMCMMGSLAIIEKKNNTLLREYLKSLMKENELLLEALNFTREAIRIDEAFHKQQREREAQSDAKFELENKQGE